MLIAGLLCTLGLVNSRLVMVNKPCLFKKTQKLSFILFYLLVFSIFQLFLKISSECP